MRQSTISECESGKKRPSLALLAELANFYGVSLDWLAGRADIPHLPGKGGEEMDELMLTNRLAALETELKRVQATVEALEQVVKDSLPLTDEQWNRLMSEARRPPTRP